MKLSREFLLAVTLAVTAGCESTSVAPVANGDLQLADDERRLWKRVAEEQAAIEQSGFVAQWPEVEAYLNQVLAGLHVEPLRAGSPIYAKVIVDPTLNAFAMPNGALYVHTGLLSAVENEAQLATVLSHEVTHATHRHGLKGYRNIKNESAFLAAFTVGTGGLGGLLGGFGVMASVSGYSQELEREADAVGFRRLVAGGYDPRESTKVFKMLLEESKRSKTKEPFFFGSHPKLTDRIRSYERLVGALPADQRTGFTHTEQYQAILPRVLIGNAEASLHAGDFDFAKACAERCLTLQPDSPAASLMIAEALRRRDAGGDTAAALIRYRELTARDPNYAEAHRGVGLTARKLGDKAGALVSFQRYLELQPNAKDRAYIEVFIRQCQNQN